MRELPFSFFFFFLANYQDPPFLLMPTHGEEEGNWMMEVSVGGLRCDGFWCRGGPWESTAVPPSALQPLSFSPARLRVSLV